MTEKEEGKIINAGYARGHDIHKLDMGFELSYSMQSWDSPFGASSDKFQDRNQATGGWAKIKDLWQAS
ncbi:unnamed protein product [Sphagnum balticum]